MRPSSSSVGGMPERQFFTFDDPAARLVIDLNIQVPERIENRTPSDMGEQSAVADSPQQPVPCFRCGKKKRTPESEDIDLNEIPTDDDYDSNDGGYDDGDDEEEEYEEEEEEYCTCEDPPLMLGIGGTNNQMPQHVGSSSSSHFGTNGNQLGQSSAAAAAPPASVAVAVAAAPAGAGGDGQQATGIRAVAAPGEAMENNGGGRSRRAMMRATPRRLVASSTVDEAAGSSSATEIPAYEEPPVFMTVAPPLPPTTVNGATPFRIRDIVSGQQDNYYNVLRSFGSRVEPHRSHPYTTRSGSYALTLGPRPTSQPHQQQISNSQPGTSLTGSSVVQNVIMETRQTLEQQRGQVAGSSTFGGVLNLSQSVGPMQLMPSSSGSNGGGEIRTNIQTTTINMQPSATPARQIRGEQPSEFLPGVENMTYEELYDLGERMGVVNTGLSEQVIQQCLKHRYYRAPQNRPSPEEGESCCICLVDFVNRDLLGKIKCSHKFHFRCIKQWLLEKNFCPLCKEIAIVPPN